MSKEFERIFPKILKKPGLFQISFEKARKSPAKKPGLFWPGLFTLANPVVKWSKRISAHREKYVKKKKRSG